MSLTRTQIDSAETTGGGVPGHVLNLPDRNTWFRYNGEMRSNDTLYEDAWKPYVCPVHIP